jgi:hypothetical protein
MLGNNRPRILVQLEDCVLRAVIGILEGRSHEDALDTLHSQILSLEKELSNNDEALDWFNVYSAPISTPSTPPPTECAFTHLPRMEFNLFLIICLKGRSRAQIFQGRFPRLVVLNKNQTSN